MSAIVLEAAVRADVGKGASRRLRREQNQIPAIVYGGEKAPESLMLPHHKVIRALEDQRIFASILEVHVEKRVERVVLKSLQRHPYKAIILHMDFQRVSAKDVLTKSIPVHFINEDVAPGLKAGGIFNHHLVQLEVRCQAQDLPTCIEIDVGTMELDGVIHLSQVVLPKKVALTADLSDSNHDLPVVSLHLPRVSKAELEAEAEEAAAHQAASAAAAESHEEEAEAPVSEEAPKAEEGEAESPADPA